MTIDWTQIEGTALRDGLLLMKEIQSLGYEAYIVGGAVRDIVMGSSHIHDVDIATNMPMDEIKKQFKAYEYGGGERHGTLLVNRNGEIFELTQFRTEGTYTDGRRPDSVGFVQSFEEDTKRRDFTINATGVNADGVVIDYHGGCEDISKRLLRTVGEASERFTEDALRMVRAIRFASKFQFQIADETLSAITQLKHLVASVSKERVRDELVKLAEVGPVAFATGLEWFDKTGLLDYMIEVKRNDMTQSQYQLIKQMDVGYFELYLSILCGGAYSSTDVELLCGQLKLTTEQTTGIVFAVASHQKLASVLELPRVDAYKLVSHRHFELLKDLYMAYTNDGSVLSDIEYLREFKVAYAMQKTISRLMLECGVKPGVAFGQMLARVLDTTFHYFETNREVPSEETIILWLESQKQ